MSIKRVLKELNFSVGKEELKRLKKETEEFVALLNKQLRKHKIDAEVFVGGSFAKKTLAKSDNYDIDIFVRFDWKYEDLSYNLEGVIKDVSKEMNFEYVRLHGSRDYFKIEKKEIIFEVIPVLRIKKVREARNITDLSYFHVNYVKKKINEKLSNEIAIVKRFCKAQGVYGAESYVHGFSGYGLECLIIYYGSFEKMLKALVKVKENERLILDPAKFYKRKDEALIELNEGKIKGPLVLIDPTAKERNALAALSRETFRKFQEEAREFLEKPRKEFFDIVEFDEKLFRELAQKKKAEFLHIVLETDRQEGDIAGTKMKKFSKFLETELREFFEILKSEFCYKGEKNSDFYLIVKPRKEVVRIGPAVTMKKDAERFKEKNKEVFEKNGRLHARMKIDFSAKEFLQDFKEKYAEKIKGMDITYFEFCI